MKKSILIVIGILLFITQTFALKAPATVQKAFQQKFPNAADVKWGKENSHEFEAEFKIGTTKLSANFSDTGEWLETETTIDFGQLPAKVQSGFNTSHPGAKVKAAAKIESSSGAIKYEIEYKQGKKTKEILYNDAGIEIKK